MSRGPLSWRMAAGWWFEVVHRQLRMVVDRPSGALLRDTLCHRPAILRVGPCNPLMSRPDLLN
jgi:hypothetical protein